LGVVFKLDSSGNETVLYRFTGKSDGGLPFGNLVRDKHGNLYGMTQYGGDPVCQCGTVFKLRPNGVLRTMHAFRGGTDGMNGIGQPGAGLRLLRGSLYGATYFGGTPGCDGNLGCGTIFKISAGGGETVLYRFSGGADGSFPQELLPDTAGNLYGVTASSYSQAFSNGSVFKLDSTNNLTVVYTFPGGSEGSSPRWRLTRAGTDLLIGATLYGGDFSCGTGLCGVAYTLDLNTDIETVLHSFGSPGDGAEPSGPLLNVSGDFFGTTWFGGVTNDAYPFGCGVVYGLKIDGNYKVLHRFSGGDGAAPNGVLVQDSDGNLYGAAALGGNNNNGLIFKITR